MPQPIADMRRVPGTREWPRCDGSPKKTPDLESGIGLPARLDRAHHFALQRDELVLGLLDGLLSGRPRAKGERRRGERSETHSVRGEKATSNAHITSGGSSRQTRGRALS